MSYTDQLFAMLDNWARWCIRTKDCYPVGYQNGAPFENAAKPYKTLVSETEALDEIERRAEPHEPSAHRMEMWINQLPVRPQVAVRVQWVYAPEEARRREHLDYDQWQERRVWKARKLLKQLAVANRRLNRSEYEREVGEGMYILRQMLTTWAERDAG